MVSQMMLLGYENRSEGHRAGKNFQVLKTWLSAYVKVLM